MELDELKTLWKQSNRKLEQSMRLNTVLLRQWNLHKARTSLQRLSLGILLELAVNVIGIVLLGAFAADHWNELRFLLPAVVLDGYAIALVAAAVRQIVDINAVDYDQPVIAIQRKLEQLRVRRIRTTMGTLLFAPLMWVPLLIVALRGLFGVDVYANGNPSWLIANALFGLAVIPVAIFAAKRFGHRFERSSAVHALADAIAGRSLAAALSDLDAIGRFEDEGS